MRTRLRTQFQIIQIRPNKCDSPLYGIHVATLSYEIKIGNSKFDREPSSPLYRTRLINVERTYTGEAKFHGA